MLAVAGIDVGGSSVKAWVHEVGGALLASVTVPTTTLRPAAHRAEFDPVEWEKACRQALSVAVQQAGAVDYLGVTVSSLRQGFVLLDAAGQVLGTGILNSDRRGAGHTEVLRGAHELTGHWPAPELTLPKLLALQATEPDRWAATGRVLFLHDWLVWLMTGVQVTEVSYACAGGMADVARRTWARDLLAANGIGPALLAPLVEAGTEVGELREGWGLPAYLPVVAGCGDTQLTAMAVGGLADGVITVVAGSSTPVQAATASPVRDPLSRPWVSTHAAPDLWAAEGNAGYPGAFSGWWSQVAGDELTDDPGGVLAVTGAPYWSQATWEHKPPASLVGLTPATTPAQVGRALLEAHAFAVAGNVTDLERALDRPATALVVAGGPGAAQLAPVLARVLGRAVHLGGEGGPALAGTTLVARALGAHHHPPSLPSCVLPAGEPGGLTVRHQRWQQVTEALRAALPE